MTNYWEILLVQWRRQGKDGLTIPFLIGSQNYFRDSHNDGIRELLISMAYSNIETYLTYCPTIRDLILGIRDEKRGNFAGKFITHNGEETNLFVSKMIDGNNLDVIIEDMIDRYQDAINSGNYSRNNRELGEYNSDDIAFIQNSFAS